MSENNKKKEEVKGIYLKCDCYSHLLETNWDGEYLEVSIWKFESHGFSLFQKLRWIWRILRGKTLWADQVLLGKESMEKLKNYLNKL
jgi:hypothetical protein